MSTRPASPPSVARWNFVLGAIIFLAVAIAAVLLSEYPPGAGTLTILMVCLALSAMLFLAPVLMEYDARVRVAEAQARDHVEQQIRRLAQTTEQLTNAISRSQSAEEQVGQALGTLEELAEKVTSQAEELAQSLARSQEREIAALKAETERLNAERDDRLGALDQRLDTANGQLSELQLTLRKQAGLTNRALDELKERLIALTSRLDDVTRAEHPVAPSPLTPLAPPAAREPAAAAVPSPAPAIATAEPERAAPPPPAAVEPASSAAAETKPPVAEPPESKAPEGQGNLTPVEQPRARAAHRVATPPVARAKPEAPAVDSTSAAPDAVASKTDGAETDTVHVAVPEPGSAAAKPRVRRSAEPSAMPPSRISPKPQPLDLPLLDLPPPKPTVHRDASGSSSTLVATAYIGIGNKLYVRGDGPGLSWEQGVPMQFLAIGKWGWTSPSAGEPITCRIYRNDETPMLDENIVIEPGAKAEVTPRF